MICRLSLLIISYILACGETQTTITTGQPQTTIGPTGQWLGVEPNDPVVVVDHHALLISRIEQKEGYVIWSKDGVDLSNDTVILDEDNTRYVVIGDQNIGEYHFGILNVTFSDAGRYKVRVDDKVTGEELVSEEGTLTVRAHQAFLEVPSDTSVVEGGSITLNVSISDKGGRVYWIKDDTVLSHDNAVLVDTTRLSVDSPTPNVEYNLQITDVKPSDAGIYTVRVGEGEYHDDPITTQPIVLTVYDTDGIVSVTGTTTVPIYSTTSRQGSRSVRTVAENSIGTTVQNTGVNVVSGTTTVQGSKPITTIPVRTIATTTVTEHDGANILTDTDTTPVPIHTTTQVASQQPGGINPLCTISHTYISYGDAVLLVCQTTDGIPPVTLQWSKDGVNYQGEWLNTGSGVGIGLEVNITTEMLGAVFICSSTYVNSTETETCEVTLQLNDIEPIPMILFWILLVIFLVALLIILHICLWRWCYRRQFCYCYCCWRTRKEDGHNDNEGLFCNPAKWCVASIGQCLCTDDQQHQIAAKCGVCYRTTISCTCTDDKNKHQTVVIKKDVGSGRDEFPYKQHRKSSSSSSSRPPSSSSDSSPSSSSSSSSSSSNVSSSDEQSGPWYKKQRIPVDHTGEVKQKRDSVQTLERNTAIVQQRDIPIADRRPQPKRIYPPQKQENRTPIAIAGMTQAEIDKLYALQFSCNPNIHTRPRDAKISPKPNWTKDTHGTRLQMTRDDRLLAVSVDQDTMRRSQETSDVTDYSVFCVTRHDTTEL